MNAHSQTLFCFIQADNLCLLDLQRPFQYFSIFTFFSAGVQTQGAVQAEIDPPLLLLPFCSSLPPFMSSFMVNTYFLVNQFNSFLLMF
jgi:hypothetical protein